MGQDVPYVPMPWFWSDQYDIKLQIAGLNRRYDAVYERRDADSDARSFWYYQGDTLLAVDAINDSRAYMVGKRLIEMGKSPTPEEAINPETSLKALLKKSGSSQEIFVVALLPRSARGIRPRICVQQRIVSAKAYLTSLDQAVLMTPSPMHVS